MRLKATELGVVFNDEGLTKCDMGAMRKRGSKRGRHEGSEGKT